MIHRAMSYFSANSGNKEHIFNYIAKDGCDESNLNFGKYKRHACI